MRFILFCSRNKSLSNQHPLSYPQLSHLRNFVDATFRLVRDRGLDHAVEREKNLKPLFNLKNFIKREPSKSVPISIIADNRETLKIPFRPIDFIRKYPSVFEELLPGGTGMHPHIRLTAETLNLDAEEQLMYQSDSYKQQVADRLLKLLMISRIHKIPLTVIEHLKWDLGLPQDYEVSIIPEFPDYFHVVDSEDCECGWENKRVLELVCWSNELATSVMEKKAMNGVMGSVKEKQLVVPVQFSNGFEMDKKYKKWLSDWQKLPYTSPYENAAHLSPTSDESDKWVVGVLHEILHILVPKKTEKYNILLLGECLGLRSRFKRALLHHPGIFYLSSKIGTYTVILREGYKRGSLIDGHPLMTLRSQYVHLMNVVKEDSKTTKVERKGKQQESCAKELEGSGEEDDENNGKENKGDGYESLDAKAEEACESDFGDDEEQSQRGNHKTAPGNRGRAFRNIHLDVKKPLRNSRRERSAGKLIQHTKEKSSSEVSKRKQMRGQHKDVESSQRLRSPKSRMRLLSSKKTRV